MNSAYESSAVGRHQYLCGRSNEVRLWLSVLAYNLRNLWRRLVLPKKIENWSLTSLQQRLVKTGGRLVKHARYYWLLLAESHLTRRLFGGMVRRIDALPAPAGYRLGLLFGLGPGQWYVFADSGGGSMPRGLGQVVRGIFLAGTTALLGLRAQDFGDLYRQAAQSYRNAASQESGATRSCMLSNASYYDCLANQLSNSSLSCTQPACAPSGGMTSTSSTTPGSSGTTFDGSSLNPMMLANFCRYCSATGTSCPSSCPSGASSSSPTFGGTASGRTGTAAAIQSGADLAVGLIQGIFNRRAAKQAAEEAQHDAETQAQQEAADRQRQAEEWQAKMRSFEAERIQSEACTTLIEAARLTGGSVDLGGDNACARAIEAELGPLSTYGAARGGNPGQPRPNNILLDGSNIPRQIDFGTQGTGSQSQNALDSLTDAASPSSNSSAPPGSGALDQLTGATTPGGGGSNSNNRNSALDQLTQDTGPTPSGQATGQSPGGQGSTADSRSQDAAGTNSLDTLASQTVSAPSVSPTQPTSSAPLDASVNPVDRNDLGSGFNSNPQAGPSGDASDSPDIAPSVAKLERGVAAQAETAVINLDADGKAILKIDKKVEEYYKLKDEVPQQVQMANRIYSGQATPGDVDAVTQRMEGQIANLGIVNPIARKSVEASQAAALEMNRTSLSTLDHTFDAIQEGLDADGNSIMIGTLSSRATYGSYIYGVAKNLPLVGKPIEKVVTTYEQWKEYWQNQ